MDKPRRALCLPLKLVHAKLKLPLMVWTKSGTILPVRWQALMGQPNTAVVKAEDVT